MSPLAKVLFDFGVEVGRAQADEIKSLQFIHQIPDELDEETLADESQRKEIVAQLPKYKI